MDLVSFLNRYMDSTVLVIGGILVLSFLFALYSIALVNKRLRLMHEEMQQLSEDNKLLNDTIQIVQKKLTDSSDAHKATVKTIDNVKKMFD